MADTDRAYAPTPPAPKRHPHPTSVENGCTRLVSVRLPLDLYEELLAVQESEGLTLTGTVCKCLAHAFNDRAVYLARKHSLERIKARREQIQRERR